LNYDYDYYYQMNMFQVHLLDNMMLEFYYRDDNENYDVVD